MKPGKNFKVIILSAFGRQAELPATNRIYSLLNGFHENGIETHLITPDLPFMTEMDLKKFKVHLVKKGLLQKSFFMALSLIKKLLGKQSSDEKSIKPVYQKGSRLMSYYTFFFYSKTLIPFLKSYWLAKKLSKEVLRENEVPVIITSVNPGCYLITGNLLKRYFGKRIIWIADYQDPIENDPFLSFKSNRIIKNANNSAFKNADCIIAPEKTVIETLIETAKSRDFDIRGKCYVLKPGINFQKYESSTKNRKRFSLIYGGTLYYERTPGLKLLLQVIKQLDEFEFIYAGFTPEVVRSLIRELGISEDRVRISDVLPKPEFEKLLEVSDILLALGTFGSSYNAPGGKIYSLLGHDKPLLIISPKTEELETTAKMAGGVYISDASEKEVMETLNQIKKDLEAKKTFRSLEFIEKNSDKARVGRFISEFLQECLRNAL